jgi:protein-L-isoaspartate O-methyltransferase
MNSDQTLYAVFVPIESYTLTVLSYDQYNNPGSVALYIDGYYVGTTMDDYSVTEGQHTLEVPTQVGYHSAVVSGWHISCYNSEKESIQLQFIRKNKQVIVHLFEWFSQNNHTKN